MFIKIKQIQCEEGLHQWVKAARKYEEINQFADAARCFENNDQTLTDAIRCYEKLNMNRDIGRCYEKLGDVYLAAPHYFDYGDIDDAFRCTTHILEIFELDISKRDPEFLKLIIRGFYEIGEEEKADNLIKKALSLKVPYKESQIFIDLYEDCQNKDDVDFLLFDNLWDLEGLIIDKITNTPKLFLESLERYPHPRIPKGLPEILKGRLEQNPDLIKHGLSQLRKDDNINTSSRKNLGLLGEKWLDQTKEELGDKYRSKHIQVHGDYTEAGATVVRGNAHVFKGNLGGTEGDKCPNCGGNYPKSAKFCNDCGHKVQQYGNRELHCEHCGCKLNSAQKFCNECGTKII